MWLAGLFTKAAGKLGDYVVKDVLPEGWWMR